MSPVRLLQAVVRRLPLLPALRLVHPLTRACVRLTAATGGSLAPWRVERFPDEVAALLGPDSVPADERLLVERRLAVLLCRWRIGRALRADPNRTAAALQPLVEVRGADHLAAALAAGRGAVALSTHFGYPQLLRPILARLGIDAVAGVALPRHEAHIKVTGDLWTRARGLLRVQHALAANRVVLFLADHGVGARVRVPFLHQTIELGVGPFHAARASASAIVPVFLVANRAPRFTLELFPPLRAPALDVRDALLQQMAEFARRYAQQVRRDPAQLPSRSARYVSEVAPEITVAG